MLLGAGSIKKKIQLTSENIFEKVEMFARLKLGCSRSHGIVTVIREMIKTGEYYPSARWIIPAQGKGMSVARAQIMYKMVHSYEEITNTDVQYIFFDVIESTLRSRWGRLDFTRLERDANVDQSGVAADDAAAAAATAYAAAEDRHVEGVPGAVIDVMPFSSPPPVPIIVDLARLELEQMRMEHTRQVEIENELLDDDDVRIPEGFGDDIPYSQVSGDASHEAGTLFVAARGRVTPNTTRTPLPLTPTRSSARIAHRGSGSGSRSGVFQGLTQNPETMDNVLEIIREGQANGTISRQRRRGMTQDEIGDFMRVD